MVSFGFLSQDFGRWQWGHSEVVGNRLELYQLESNLFELFAQAVGMLKHLLAPSHLVQLSLSNFLVL